MEKLNETLYCFERVDGSREVLSIEDARLLGDEKINKRIENIILNLKNKKMKRDGFEPGIQANTGLYAGGPGEYAKQLKELGLVEIGYDYIPQEGRIETNHFANEELLQSIVETGEFNDQQIDAIKSGEYLKDVELDLGED